MKAYEITFQSGIKIIFQPKSDAAKIFINEVQLPISATGEIKDEIKTKFEIVSVVQVNELLHQENMATAERLEINGLQASCIICMGWRYCITGGCANTPCGWICHPTD